MATRRMLELYRTKFAKALVTGDVTELHKLNTEPFDHILSHRLFHLLSTQNQLKMLAGSIHLLKPGGTVRFYPAFCGASFFDYLRNSGYHFEIVVLDRTTEMQWHNGQGFNHFLKNLDSFTYAELESMNLSAYREFLEKANFPHLSNFGRLLVVRKTANNTTHTSREMMALIDENYANAGSDIEGIPGFPEPKYAFWRYLKRHSPLSLKEARRVILELETDALWHQAIESTFEDIDELTKNAEYIEDVASLSRLDLSLSGLLLFHEQWIAMGKGASEKDRLRTGLSKWVEAVQKGGEVQWPRPKSVHDAQLLSLRYKESKSLRSDDP
jgi:hypothetical protein